MKAFQEEAELREQTHLSQSHVLSSGFKAYAFLPSQSFQHRSGKPHAKADAAAPGNQILLALLLLQRALQLHDYLLLIKHHRRWIDRNRGRDLACLVLIIGDT